MRLTMAHNKEKANNAKGFAELTFAGKVKVALQLISKEKGDDLTPDQPLGED